MSSHVVSNMAAGADKVANFAKPMNPIIMGYNTIMGKDMYTGLPVSRLEAATAFAFDVAGGEIFSFAGKGLSMVLAPGANASLGSVLMMGAKLQLGNLLESELATTVFSGVDSALIQPIKGLGQRVGVFGGVERTLYHTVTNSNIAQSVLNGIDSDFFNASSRFGEGFYLSEVPDTTLAELAHHDVVGVDTIRYDFNAKAAKILDLTKSRLAKNWGYEGGNITPFTREIGARARDAGFNAIRFSSERGSGANLVLFKDFDNLLSPKMVVPAPEFDSNYLNGMRR